ncbi:MAG: GNAT family N-acetyltransferase [Parvibaculaceae bacterium]
MSDRKRPVGFIVDPLPPGIGPDGRPLYGRYVRLEAISAAKHARQLYDSFVESDPEGAIWTYLGYGPFPSFEAFRTWVEGREPSRDPYFYAFIRKDTGEAAGMGAFMRLDAANGVIEIGHIWMVPALQKTREATEAIYLMMRHCFDELGVRRLEWKCDSLNAPSRKAAERFGFTYEGIFRQHFIVKGRNRDTTWYAMIDREWPAMRQRFNEWLRPENFDAEGRQKRGLNAPPDEALDIWSKGEYPSNVLSNFGQHPFTIDGVAVQSMEAFLQSLTFADPDRQREVWSYPPAHAKSAGGKQNWKKDMTLHWKGVAIDRMGEAYQALLDRAYDALFEQSETFRRALAASGNRPLTHSMGKADPRRTILTNEEFLNRLNRLREKLKSR